MEQDVTFDIELPIGSLAVSLSVFATVTKTIDVADGKGSADYTIEDIYDVRINNIEQANSALGPLPYGLEGSPFGDSMASLALELLIVDQLLPQIETALNNLDNTELFV